MKEYLQSSSKFFRTKWFNLQKITKIPIITIKINNIIKLKIFQEIGSFIY